MKIQQFSISFDDAEVNPQAVYRSGQTINLRVYLKLLEPVKCRAVYISFHGSSKVHWTEEETRGSGDNSHTETVDYNSEEVYIDQNVSIYSPEASGPNADHHPAGEFIYLVSFQLPPTAPSSYEGDFGRIRYLIKANIDRPWKFDSFCQKFFTVIRDLDLNTWPADEVGPYSTDEDFDVNCCYCCNCCFGKVRVCVALPKKGFVPGEQVHVTGEIRNTSSTNLEGVNLEIYQRSIFHARGKTKTSCRVASVLQFPGIMQHESMQLNHLLPVNPMPSSRIEGCQNIDVHYFFRLNADGGCCLSVTKECCELVIGNVPLWSAMQPTQLPMLRQPDSAQQIVSPPPSYEECMFGRVEMDKEEGKRFGDQQGATQWAPSYPVFAMASAPPSV